MTTTMQWRRAGDTAMRCDPWTVGKVIVRGETSYELWHDKQPAVVGRFKSFDAAKAEAERIELAGQA